jgi:hypothetical protein
MKLSVNNRRADLDLPQFDLPPAEPVFSPNPVAELVITNAGGKITLKLRVPSPPAQYTLVQGAIPVRTGVRFVQHFPFLGLLPPPTDGWSDITELYVARYGVPKAGTAIWIRTCQHTAGRGGGGQALVAWPARYSDFTLEEAASLPPQDWTLIASFTNQWLVPASGKADLRFYRLRRPQADPRRCEDTVPLLSESSVVVRKLLP